MSELIVGCELHVKDVYIITSMTIVIMVCVWHAVIPAIFREWGSEVADKSDVAVAVALSSAYIIAHIVFAVVIATRVRMTPIVRSTFRPGYHNYSVSQKNPPEDLRQSFQNGWEFFNQILHAYHAFISTLDYKFSNFDEVMPY